MKQDLKESLQFIMQHPAIGSPLVQHAQNLARHVTSQQQVTDEQIKSTIRELDDCEAFDDNGVTSSAVAIVRKMFDAVPPVDVDREYAAAHSYALSAPPAAVPLNANLVATSALNASAAPEEAKPVAGDWQHVANEWADVATSALQWLRNVVDGTSHGEAAITNTENCIEQCLRLQAKVRAATSQPFTYYKEPHQGWPEYSKQNEFSDGSGGGLALYAAPQEQAPLDTCALTTNGMPWGELAQEQAPADKDAIRNAALEEAALICDKSYVEPGDLQVENCHEAAAAIRALQSQPQQVTK